MTVWRDSRTIELVQCKHTVWDARIDADVVAEVTRACEGYRAKRFRGLHGTTTLRGVLVTNGTLTRAARRTAAERDIRVHNRHDLTKLLAASIGANRPMSRRSSTHSINGRCTGQTRRIEMRIG